MKSQCGEAGERDEAPIHSATLHLEALENGKYPFEGPEDGQDEQGQQARDDHTQDAWRRYSLMFQRDIIFIRSAHAGDMAQGTGLGKLFAA